MEGGGGEEGGGKGGGEGGGMEGEEGTVLYVFGHAKATARVSSFSFLT